MPRLLPWLDQRNPDVVCLQETKLADAAFTDLLGDELGQRGYETALHGEAAWNGVAILSRVGLDYVVPGLAGGPAVGAGELAVQLVDQPMVQGDPGEQADAGASEQQQS